jgi:hypothetical protein
MATLVCFTPITVPVPHVIAEGVASAIANAIVASGNSLLLSSAAGLLPVCTLLPDRSLYRSTLAAYLAEFGLKLKDVVPYMVDAGFVVIVSSGPTTAFALPGTVMAASSVDGCDTTGTRAEICDRAAQLAPLRLSAIGNDPCIVTLMAQLKVQDPYAKLKDVLATDPERRFIVDGTLGLTTVLLATTLVSQGAPVPPTSVSAGGRAGVPPVPGVVLDYIQEKGSTKLSLLMLQPAIARAVNATNFKIGQLAKADGRFKVTGDCGSKMLSLAAPEA